MDLLPRYKRSAAKESHGIALETPCPEHNIKIIQGCHSAPRTKVQLYPTSYTIKGQSLTLIKNKFNESLVTN